MNSRCFRAKNTVPWIPVPVKVNMWGNMVDDIFTLVQSACFPDASYCTGLAGCARAVVVSRNIRTPWRPRRKRAPAYLGPEFTLDDGYESVEEDERGPIYDGYEDMDGETDGDTDGVLAVLDPDTLQQVRVIGSDINPLGTFRFEKATNHTNYTCFMAFEPLENMLLVADGRNKAVHVINVFDGTHAGFAATPAMCGFWHPTGLAVKQTSPTTCTAVVGIAYRVLVLTHAKNGPWALMTCVECDVLGGRNSLHFFGPGQSFVAVPVSDCSGHIVTFAQSPSDPVTFTPDRVRVAWPKTQNRGSSAFIRIRGLDRPGGGVLVVSDCTPLSVLQYDENPMRITTTPCKMDWTGGVNSFWRSTKPTDECVILMEIINRKVYLHKFLAKSATRLAWMSAVFRARGRPRGRPRDKPRSSALGLGAVFALVRSLLNGRRL